MKNRGKGGGNEGSLHLGILTALLWVSLWGELWYCVFRRCVEVAKLGRWRSNKELGEGRRQNGKAEDGQGLEPLYPTLK